MLNTPAPSRRRPASVSFTYFYEACRSTTTDATSVYFDSRAQDRSMTIDARVGSHVVVARS